MMEGVYNGSKIIDKRIDLIINESKFEYDMNVEKFNKIYQPQDKEQDKCDKLLFQNKKD